MARKELGGITIPKDDDPEEIKKRLTQGAADFPSLKKGSGGKKPAKQLSPRTQKSISLPEYVWDEIRDYCHKEKISMNVLIMKGLKAYGLTVKTEDLIDGRKVR